MAADDFIPVYEPWLTEADALAVADTVRSGWISSEGPALERFELALAEQLGVAHAVAVSSGTLALELALSALGIGPGDEVLCPAFCIIACARAIVSVGATPVLVDARPGDYNLDLAAAERRVGPRTRALLAVHTYGLPLDAEALVAFVRRHRLQLVEDAAEAHGAQLCLEGSWLQCGSLGDVGVLSFYANKIVTTGEGGALLTRSAELAARLRSLRNLSFDPERRFVHAELGTNARLSSLAAALGLSQLSRFEQVLANKRRVALEYQARLAEVRGVTLPTAAPHTRAVPWMVALTLDDDVGLLADEFGRRLRARGVGTRPFFVGMHEQPALLERGLFAGERHPVTERLSRRGLYLPSSPQLTIPTIERVVEALRAALVR